MKITTHYNSDYEYTSVTEEGHSVQIDMKSENKTNQSPMQLLLSALAGCAVVEVALMIQKKRRKLVDLKVELEGKRREENPRSFTNIHLIFTLISPDATLEELEKVTKLGLENYCSVRSSLNAEVTFECKIVRE
jgi:putative redox protein